MTIGVDIGGTSTRVGAVDAAGDIVVLAESATPHGAEAVTAHLLREVGAVIAQVPERPVAMGVGIPGRIDPTNRELSMAVNLGIVRPTPLAATLESALGIPVTLGNDVDLAAVGAHHHAEGAHHSLAYVSIGTGFAVGLVLDGTLHRGARGAGEIGHVPIPGGTEPCSCGQTGCVETLASGGAMLRAWGRTGAGIDALWTAADDGDGRATTIRDRAIDAITWAVQCTTMLFDPDAIIIGGGVSRLGSRLLDPLITATRERADVSALLASYGIADRLSSAPVDAQFGVAGAAVLARSSVGVPASATTADTSDRGPA